MKDAKARPPRPRYGGSSTHPPFAEKRLRFSKPNSRTRLPLMKRTASLALVLMLTVAASAGTFEIAGLKLTTPDSWQSVPPSSPLRQGQWAVAPLETGQDAGEITAFYFGPGQGGDTASNVNRWLASLKKPDGSAIEGKTTTRTVRGIRITQVEGFGVFASGMPGQPTTPKPDYGLLGGILEGPQGRVFLKLTGPAKLVEAQRASFTAMLDSVSAK
jgi:hypothetical protein